MPTVITHALVGGSLSQAGPAPYPRWKVAVVLAALSLLPDLDVAGYLMGVPYASTFGHRGITHSIPFAAVMSFVLCAALFRGQEMFKRKWWALYAVAFTATASHGLLDAATDAGLGIGLFIPFDDTRVFYSFRPIRTAPIRPSGFLQMRTLGVIWSEVLWIWLPLFSAIALARLGAYLYRRGRNSRR